MAVPSAPAPAPPESLGEGPALPETPRAPTPSGLLGDADYDLPVEANSWVEAELEFLVGQRHDVIARWLSRGDFYEGFIKRTLASTGVPTDLFHLAMIESGFVPTARSRAGAVGMWQFMPRTGRSMGLRVDTLVDERIDPVRSTRAAARHLRDLHRDLGGNWALAAAAYNAGSGRITRGLRAAGVDNFWQLAIWGDLAEETKHYVPRLYAATVIARNRSRWGFGEAATTDGFAYDSLSVDDPTSLRELARIAGVSEEGLLGLNPHLLRGETPPGEYHVWIPRGSAEQMEDAYTLLRLLPAQPPAPAVAAATATESPAPAAANLPATALGDPVNHRVAWGESLWGLARRYGVSVEEIQRANDLRGSTIVVGMRLRIPAAHTPERQAEGAGRGHTVRHGETLWSIARENGTTVETLERANAIEGDAIYPGQTILIPR